MPRRWADPLRPVLGELCPWRAVRLVRERRHRVPVCPPSCLVSLPSGKQLQRPQISKALDSAGLGWGAVQVPRRAVDSGTGVPRVVSWMAFLPVPPISRVLWGSGLSRLPQPPLGSPRFLPVSRAPPDTPVWAGTSRAGCAEL